MDKAYIRLRDAIVEQAVQDYCTYTRKIVFLNDREKSIESVKKEVSKWKPPQTYNDEQAEEVVLERIKLNKCKMEDIERFFRKKWYRQMCDIDGEYMISKKKEKAIEDMVRLCIVKLKNITEKNRKSKKSQKAISDFHTLKLFLTSEHLAYFTKHTGDYYINKIITESGFNCVT